MQATGRKDTAPELALRRELHRRGLRYRVEVKLPEIPRRRMDIVFTRARLVVLVDGCFWHGCPLHATTAKANAGYWADKIAANQARDADTDTRLRAAGWTVLRAWEHEDPATTADRVEALIRPINPT
jgi:DNA mismatch endonuclease (patch repair protein)